MPLLIPMLPLRPHGASELKQLDINCITQKRPGERC